MRRRRFLTGLLTLTTSSACTAVTSPEEVRRSDSSLNFRVLHAEDFREPTRMWARYNGRPGSDPRARWHPSMAVTTLEGLELRGRSDGQRWLTGGISFWRVPITYGRVTIRARGLVHDVLSYHLLMWPSAEDWPPEIDICESFDSHRQNQRAYLHFPGGSERADYRVDGTQWCTYTMVWTPTEIIISVDGVEQARFTENIPHEKMFLALQVETHSGERDPHGGAQATALVVESAEIAQLVL